VDVPWWLILLGLEFPALMALLDCYNRGPDHFAGGEPDRQSWLRWLVVGIITVPLLVGNGIVIGYYYSVIKRNSPASPG
jgi:hypothetical protein